VRLVHILGDLGLEHLQLTGQGDKLLGEARVVEDVVQLGVACGEPDLLACEDVGELLLLEPLQSRVRPPQKKKKERKKKKSVRVAAAVKDVLCLLEVVEAQRHQQRIGLEVELEVGEQDRVEQLDVFGPGDVRHAAVGVLLSTSKSKKGKWGYLDR